MFYHPPAASILSKEYLLLLVESVTVESVAVESVKKLVDGSQDIGYHSISWDCIDDEGNKAEPSEYLCVMQSGMFIKIQHLMIWY